MIIGLRQQSVRGLLPSCQVCTNWLVLQKSNAIDVASWPVSAEEARQWAGPGVQWPLDQSVFGRWHSDPDVQPYVHHADGVLVGYGELWVDSEQEEVEVTRVIVRPQNRSTGYGRQLVLLLLEKARLTGYPNAFIRVVPNNTNAIACYRGVGFVPVTDSEEAAYNLGQPTAYTWLKKELKGR
jgi:ribosomal protein S18 acetylase RimI-like enzyme